MLVSLPVLPIVCNSCQINSRNYSLILLLQGLRDTQVFTIIISGIKSLNPVEELPFLVGNWLRKHIFRSFSSLTTATTAQSTLSTPITCYRSIFKPRSSLVSFRSLSKLSELLLLLKIESAVVEISNFEVIIVPGPLVFYTKNFNLDNKLYLFPQIDSQDKPKYWKFISSAIDKSTKFQDYWTSRSWDTAFGKFLVVVHLCHSVEFLLPYNSYCNFSTTWNFYTLQV